jgi:hypothetical protein
MEEQCHDLLRDKNLLLQLARFKSSERVPLLLLPLFLSFLFLPAMFGENAARQRARTPDRNHPVESARHHHARLGL